jgi:hypothetical protein
MPTPGNVVRATRSVARYTLDTAVFAVALPARLARLLIEVESLVVRVSAVVDGASQTADQARATARAADEVVAVAGRVTETTQALLRLWEPIATRGAALTRQFVDGLSPDEVAAAVRMVDQLPRLAEHLETDVMPILATLDKVGPDVHNLLDVAKDVREAILGIPGFGFLRKRGEAKLEEEAQAEREDEAPQAEREDEAPQAEREDEAPQAQLTEGGAA